MGGGQEGGKEGVRREKERRILLKQIIEYLNIILMNNLASKPLPSSLLIYIIQKLFKFSLSFYSVVALIVFVISPSFTILVLKLLDHFQSHPQSVMLSVTLGKQSMHFSLLVFRWKDFDAKFALPSLRRVIYIAVAIHFYFE